MGKLPLVLLALFLCHLTSYGQTASEKMLFVIDSIPQITDPEEGNTITDEDIADMVVIRNKDSLRRLGWPQVDGITYIFTHAYRVRPDSVKQIAGLLQMTQRDNIWYFRGQPYSGRYIDYYNNGHKKDEGVMDNGSLNGKVIVYYQSGAVKSETGYRAGMQNGDAALYFKNGALMQKQGFINGKKNVESASYYRNGQAEGEWKKKKNTRYDTFVSYYSTGKIKSIRLLKNGERVESKNEEDINYYTTMFLQSWNRGDTKEMEKNVSHLWNLDSTRIETRFYEGILLQKEFRFNEAIQVFDQLLATEPLDRNTHLWSSLLRLQKQHFHRTGFLLKDGTEIPVTLEDLATLPEEERRKVCYDLQLADELDFSDSFVKKKVPADILNYCKNPGNL